MTAIDYDALLADYGQAMYDEGCYEAAHDHRLAKEARGRASSSIVQFQEAIRALRAALAESERDAGRYRAIREELCYDATQDDAHATVGVSVPKLAGAPFTPSRAWLMKAFDDASDMTIECAKTRDNIKAMAAQEKAK